MSNYYNTRLDGIDQNRARRYVFKLIHVSHQADLAWHPDLGWTQFRLGWAFTYNQACDHQYAIPAEGRWHAIGHLIYSVE